VDEDRESGPDRGSDTLSEAARKGEPAGAEAADELPRSLRRSLDRRAEEFLAECSAARNFRRRVTLPWSLACAFFALAVAGWWPRLFAPGTERISGASGQWVAKRSRERMLESGPAVGHWPWGDQPGPVSGDVVWDNERQQGYLLVRGLAPNDPRQARYQVWIFDAGRDDRYPVDGGLFDVPGGREDLVVPVRASVRVSRPAAFAVTVEPPDGAVVSTREQVVAIARTDR
jgi:hypothetical protein